MSRIEQLETSIGRLGSAVVAFSGGVDSSLVAALAYRALAERALAVTAVSGSLATGELDGARRVARSIGIAHETVSTAELDREGYRRNGPDRCFYCKTELYERLTRLAERRGFAIVLSGANADDLGDWRPGLRAAADYGVAHPLLQAGVDKQEVRSLARELRIPSANKPASPCLASRIPHGTPVQADVLAQIDRAERALRRLGYRELRVRHFGERGRVELAGEDLRRALTPAGTDAISAAVEEAGYTHVEIDTEPLRSGSLTRRYLELHPVAPRTV